MTGHELIAALQSLSEEELDHQVVNYPGIRPYIVSSVTKDLYETDARDGSGSISVPVINLDFDEEDRDYDWDADG